MSVDGRYTDLVVLLDAVVGTKGLRGVSRPGAGSDLVSWWIPTCDGVGVGKRAPAFSSILSPPPCPPSPSPAFPKRVARLRSWNDASVTGVR